MAVLIREVCHELVCKPEALALVLFLIFCAIGGTYMAGVRGRRRLWNKKVEVDAFKEAKDELKTTLARLEERVWRLGTNKPQDPLSQETIDLVNQKA